jgi:hypothetical protein
MILFQNGIEPILLDEGEMMSPVELADRAAEYTVLIRCN